MDAYVRPPSVAASASVSAAADSVSAAADSVSAAASVVAVFALSSALLESAVDGSLLLPHAVNDIAITAAIPSAVTFLNFIFLTSRN